MHVLILNCIQVHYTIYWILFQALFGENAELSRAFALFRALKNGVLRKNYRELKLMGKIIKLNGFVAIAVRNSIRIQEIY